MNLTEYFTSKLMAIVKKDSQSLLVVDITGNKAYEDMEQIMDLSKQNTEENQGRIQKLSKELLKNQHEFSNLKTHDYMYDSIKFQNIKKQMALLRPQNVDLTLGSRKLRFQRVLGHHEDLFGNAKWYKNNDDLDWVRGDHSYSLIFWSQNYA